nr:hypothetical protein [Tepidiforma sp.]
MAGALDETGRVPLYIPLVALGLPVLDTAVAFLRRFLDGRNPMHADFDHFHDRIERLLGLTGRAGDAGGVRAHGGVLRRRRCWRTRGTRASARRW